MLDFPIDPELRIRGDRERMLRRTTDAVKFLRQMSLGRPDGLWMTILQMFQDIRDEWSAMEAVVQLELALEAEGLLIEETRCAPGETVPIARSA